MGTRGVHVTYKKRLPGRRAASSALSRASPPPAYIQLSFAFYGRGCVIVLGGLALHADLTRGTIGPAASSQHLDARDAGAILSELIARRGSVEEPISRTDAVGAVMGLMHACRHGERPFGQVLRLLGVEHALVEDGCRASHTINVYHGRMVVVAGPHGGGVVHGVAHGPVIGEILAGAGLSRRGPGVT